MKINSGILLEFREIDTLNVGEYVVLGDSVMYRLYSDNIARRFDGTLEEMCDTLDVCPYEF